MIIKVGGLEPRGPIGVYAYVCVVCEISINLLRVECLERIAVKPRDGRCSSAAAESLLRDSDPILLNMSRYVTPNCSEITIGL